MASLDRAVPSKWTIHLQSLGLVRTELIWALIGAGLQMVLKAMSFLLWARAGLSALYCRAGQGLEGTNLSTQHCMEKPLELQVLSSKPSLLLHPR